jgi:BASS family bile acid:Na+ symporter
MILLPLTVFCIGYLLPLSPTQKVGLVLIAACPGGTASNLVTFLLKGRVALSITLTAFNSFLILLTIPMLLNLAIGVFMGDSQSIALPAGPTVRQVVLSVLLPVLAGLFTHQYFPELTSRLKKTLRYFLPALLLVVFGLVLFLGDDPAEQNLEKMLSLYPAGLLLNLGTIALGYFLSLQLGIDHRSSYTIAIEMGLQNSALAVFIAHGVLGNSELSLMAVAYGSFSFFTTMGAAYWLSRQFRPEGSG